MSRRAAVAQRRRRSRRDGLDAGIEVLHLEIFRFSVAHPRRGSELLAGRVLDQFLRADTGAAPVHVRAQPLEQTAELASRDFAIKVLTFRPQALIELRRDERA